MRAARGARRLEALPPELRDGLDAVGELLADGGGPDDGDPPLFWVDEQRWLEAAAALSCPSNTTDTHAFSSSPTRPLVAGMRRRPGEPTVSPWAPSVSADGSEAREGGGS
eukprot:2227709-Pyramimonas_sp.AAC.1